MGLLLISFIAGVLTVLAPCILPLLPVVIGTSVGARSKATPFIVIGSLALSIFLFTYLLKASTLLIDIPVSFWSYLSGGILAGFGLILLFPKLWESLPIVGKANSKANKLMGTGYQKKNFWGDVLIGASLGPVFSTCSPTYFVILGTVLPASFLLGTVYLLAYIAGLVLVLSLISILGQRFTGRLQNFSDNKSWFKRGLGILFIIIGIMIITGLDKKLETAILDTGYLNISIFEQKILDDFLEEENLPANSANENSLEEMPLNEEDKEIKNNAQQKEQAETGSSEVKNSKETESVLTNTLVETANFTVPSYLKNTFLNTDWSKADPAIEKALSGGPGKDGIPALDNPSFIPISDFSRSDSIQAIVVKGESTVKVYPYNILTWHEIVNDKIDGLPIAVTFCPLCGSAIVYNRTLPNGQVSTFGVSGSLIESNMVMYDRTTENLWQQSTGEALAGSLYPAKLKIEPFQLMTIGEIKDTYSDAIVLSEKTGHLRNYGDNPYAGYETSNNFVFDPSNVNTRYPAKTIMVVFSNEDSTIATPWLKLREVGSTTATIEGVTYNLSVSENAELVITDTENNEYPFYFEMWFSYAVQHEGNQQVIPL